MPTLEELQEQINEIKQSMVNPNDLAAIKTEFSTQLNGTAARLQRTSKDAFDKVEQALEQLSQKFDSQEQPPQTKPKANAGETSTHGDAPQNNPEKPQSDPRISQLEQQVANLMQSNQNLQSKVEESDRARLEALKRQQSAGYEAQFISAASPYTDHPQRLFTLAKTEGKFTEVEGQGLMVQTEAIDQAGNFIQKPATEFVGEWLQNDFPFLAKPRGGNGTGITPEEQSQPSQPIQAQSVFESMTKDLD
ncbi:MAG: hypothetical protein J7647_32115 [Cyanobacteria bacterium SBLK]|nr:hypothetical protein [Cyanobacteria bacterium SBLK]